MVKALLRRQWVTNKKDRFSSIERESEMSQWRHSILTTTQLNSWWLIMIISSLTIGRHSNRIIIIVLTSFSFRSKNNSWENNFARIILVWITRSETIIEEKRISILITSCHWCFFCFYQMSSTANIVEVRQMSLLVDRLSMFFYLFFLISNSIDSTYKRWVVFFLIRTQNDCFD